MIDLETLANAGVITEHVRQGHAFFVAPSGTTRNWLNALFPHLERKDSPQEAHDAAVSGRGDVIFMADGEHGTTGADVLNVTKSNLAFIALSRGGFPRAILKPLTQNKKSIIVDVAASKILFLGIGSEPDLTAGNIGVDIRGKDVYCIGCKFAGDLGDAVQIGGGVDNASARVRILDSEFEFANRHLVFRKASGSGNLNTQIEIAGCRFHNASGGTARCIKSADATGSVQNSFFLKNIFLRNEDGSEPDKYVEVNAAAEKNDWIGNRFSTANQTSAKMLVAAAAEWVENWTRAGVSSGLPT